MKDNNSTSKSPSGIIITDNISLSLPKKRSFWDYIPLFIIALCGCAGTVNSFVSMFRIDISYLSLNFYILFFFLMFSVLFSNPKGISLPGIPICLVYEFFMYRKWDRYLNGLMLVCNQVYGVIYPERGEYFRIDMSEINPDADIKIFFIFSIFLLTAIICCLSIVWPDFYFGFIFTFPFVEIGLYHGKTPHLIPAFMLLVYWVSLLTLHHSGYYRSTKRNKTGFVRKQNSFFSKPAIKMRSAAQSGIIMVTVSAAVIALSFAVINISGYSRPKKINIMRSNVKSAVSEFNIDDISGSLEKLSGALGFTGNASSMHRIGNFDSVSYNGKTDLVVTLSRGLYPSDNIYLKGYVGSVYDGKSWRKFDRKIYEDAAEIFEQIHPQDMLYNTYGQKMLSFYSRENLKMTVKPSTLHRKYMYTPYNSLSLLPEEELEYTDDTIIDTDNKKKYSFEVSSFQDYSGIITESSLDPYEYERYHDFVYENYLDVPNNDDTLKLWNKFIRGNNVSDVYEQLSYINSVLSENAVYTLSPGKTPADRDFVSYFLLENHKGYCVHFATAGILLARMSGIPARYAEGYVLLSSDININNYKDGEYRIEIPDKRAHAWAEVYINGYGWVPYEFTSSAAALDPRESPETTMKTTSKTSHTTTTVKITSPITHRRSSTYSTTVKRSNSSPFAGRDIEKIISEISPEIKLLLMGVLAVIAAVCVILAVHSLVIKKREKGFTTGSNSRNAINAYNYIVKLLEFCDISSKNMQYLEFAEFAEQSDKRIFRPGTFREMTGIALEAGMSDKEIEKEQAERIVMFSYKTALSIFRKQNAFGKLYMKFIRNLC